MKDPMPRDGKHGATATESLAAMLPTAKRRTVKRTIQIDKAACGGFAVGAIRLAAEGMNGRLGPAVQVERKHRTAATVTAATAAGWCGSVKFAVQTHKSRGGVRPVGAPLLTAEGIMNRFDAAVRVKRKDGTISLRTTTIGGPIECAVHVDQAAPGILAIRAAAEGVHHRLCSGMPIERKHGTDGLGAANFRGAVQNTIHIDQTSEGCAAITTILLAAKYMEHRLRAGIQIDRENRTATVTAAPEPVATSHGCPVQHVSGMDQPALGIRAVRTGLKGVEHHLGASVAIKRKHHPLVRTVSTQIGRPVQWSLDGDHAGLRSVAIRAGLPAAEVVKDLLRGGGGIERKHRPATLGAVAGTATFGGPEQQAIRREQTGVRAGTIRAILSAAKGVEDFLLQGILGGGRLNECAAGDPRKQRYDNDSHAPPNS